MLNEPPQEKFRFLSGVSDVKTIDNSGSKKYKNVITVDAPNLSRIAMVRDRFAEDAFIINIDHHSDNVSFGNINICYDASSSAEILYRLIKMLDIPFTKELAEMIYTGVIYDTGVFRFSITTELAYTIGAEMKRVGARVDKIAEKIFFTKDYETIKLLSHVINGLNTYENGKVGIITLMLKEIDEICSKKPDLDDFINYLMMVKGIEIGVFLTEVQRDHFRVSLRAKDDFNVQRIAAAFSGGGHKKAAGCRVDGYLDEVREIVLKEIRKYLPDSP
jgi:phosphoesterase RecJ-like protein